MKRRTKILATLGPASESPDELKKMIEAGVNCVRCNFSHGEASQHKARVDLIRRLAKEAGRTVGILADLQGPKIRVARFEEGHVMLEAGQPFILDADYSNEGGTIKCVGIDYKDLPRDVDSGDILLLDDGRITLEVETVKGAAIHTKVIEGGKLSNNKGINKRGGGLSAPALTEKDKKDLEVVVRLDIDYVAVSFPRSAADMEEAQSLLDGYNCKAGLIAKIERTEAVVNMDGIIRASAGVMVARGDLAVEIGAESVPRVQKDLIQRARELDKIAITATEMMESMITSPTPTRAEVSDVANAVLDGTDAVMCSAETAVGKHPSRVIETMSRVICEVEKHRDTRVSNHRLECEFERVDEAIAMATMYTANHLPQTKAIITLTESGNSALWMSRIRSHIPIFALTRNIETMGRMTLIRGVKPVYFDVTQIEKRDANRRATEVMLERDEVKLDDWVILTSGDHLGILGGTNKMKIVQVGHVK